MLDDALAHCEGEIEAAKCGVALFEPSDDAEGVQVVIETEAVVAERLVESFFSGMTKGRMADVVSESESFGEFLVEAESGGNGAGDLGDFECVGEAAAKVIAGEISSEPREDLSFSSKAAEGSCMKNAGPVARE